MVAPAAEATRAKGVGAAKAANGRRLMIMAVVNDSAWLRTQPLILKAGLDRQFPLLVLALFRCRAASTMTLGGREAKLVLSAQERAS